MSEIPNSQPSSPAPSPRDNLEDLDDLSRATTEQSDKAHLDLRDSPEHATTKIPASSADGQDTRAGNLDEKLCFPQRNRSALPPPEGNTPRDSDSTPSAPEIDAGADRLRATARPTPANTSTTPPSYHRTRITKITELTAHTKLELTSTLQTLQPMLVAMQNRPSCPSKPTNTSASSSSTTTHLNAQDTQTLAEAERILKDHVALLSRYNAVKDAGMAMLGILAEQRGMTVRAMMAEREVDEGD